jgi:hypothetical protein
MRHLFLLALLSVPIGAFADHAVTIKEITPGSGPSTGGTEVTIAGSGFRKTVQCLLPCPTTVSFGSTTVPLKAESDTRLIAVTPPHENGTVDVTVNVAGEAPVTKASAFTFSATEDFRYERILVPFYLDGSIDGAFGSRWKTDLWIRNNGAEAVDLGPWACASDVPCSDDSALLYALRAGRSQRNLPPLPGPANANPSRVLYVSRWGAGEVSFSLRFADVSRFSLDGGVDLPVIREREMLSRVAQLFNVPLGPSFRGMLRLYDVGRATSAFLVTIYRQGETDEPPLHSVELTATSVQAGEFAPRAAYVQFDISSLFAIDKPWPDTARIEVTPLTPESTYWAFISLTNNDTQTVTLVTPQ